MILRPMLSSDIDFAVGCAAAEGWVKENREEFAGFLAYDPQSSFVAEVDGTRAGICVATRYGESGFIGNLIVIKERRGQSIGRRLLEHAIAYLHGRGVQNVYLDAAPAAISLYERVGFRLVCRSLRFSGHLEGRVPSHVRAMQADDLETIAELDRSAFGDDRAFFLHRRFSLYPELGKVLELGGQIAGFIMGRRRDTLISVGPWIVRPEVERAGDLLVSVAAEAGPLPVILGILETNVEAVATARSFGLVERPNPSWRMVLGPGGNLGFSKGCYAIGSPAKG